MSGDVNGTNARMVCIITGRASHHQEVSVSARPKLLTHIKSDQIDKSEQPTMDRTRSFDNTSRGRDARCSSHQKMEIY